MVLPSQLLPCFVVANQKTYPEDIPTFALVEVLFTGSLTGSCPISSLTSVDTVKLAKYNLQKIRITNGYFTDGNISL